MTVDQIMLILGAVLALIYVGIAFRAGSSASMGFLGRIVLLGASVLLVVGNMLSILGANRIHPWAVGVSIGLLLLSMLLIVWERRHERAVYGPVGAGTAVSVLVAVIATPYLFDITGLDRTTRQDALLTQVAVARSQNTDETTVLTADEPQTIPTLPTTDPEDPTSTRTPIPPTVTPTPFTFSVPTAVPPLCTGEVLTNLNFREEMSLAADILTVIPEDTRVDVFEQVDGWLQVEYDDERGWVSSEFMQLDARCDL